MINKIVQINVNGIKSLPNKVYPAIRVKNIVSPMVVRTRNTWNSFLTGRCVVNDQYVTDIQQEYYCPQCGRKELLWQSDFTKDNDYVISCDYCKKLTFLKPVFEQDEDSQTSLFDIYKAKLDSYGDNNFNYWLDNKNQVIWVTFGSAELQNYKVKLTFKSNFKGTGVEFNLFVKNEWEYLFIPLDDTLPLSELFNTMFMLWLESEENNIRIYFEIVGSL